jgi:hypothetical protein
MVTGMQDDHSSYRSELTGLLASLIFTQAIYSLQNITTGTITIGCGGLSALDKTASEKDAIPLYMPEFENLCSIRKKISLLSPP